MRPTVWKGSYALECDAKLVRVQEARRIIEPFDILMWVSEPVRTQNEHIRTLIETMDMSESKEDLTRQMSRGLQWTWDAVGSGESSTQDHPNCFTHTEERRDRLSAPRRDACFRRFLFNEKRRCAHESHLASVHLLFLRCPT